LHRGELVQLDVGDFEHAQRLIHLRAEMTKFQRAREVAIGVTSSQLFLAYPNERRGMNGNGLPRGSIPTAFSPYRCRSGPAAPQPPGSSTMPPGPS
jgi:hypothetical protein